MYVLRGFDSSALATAPLCTLISSSQQFTGAGTDARPETGGALVAKIQQHRGIRTVLSIVSGLWRCARVRDGTGQGTFGSSSTPDGSERLRWQKHVSHTEQGRQETAYVHLHAQQVPAFTAAVWTIQEIASM